MRVISMVPSLTESLIECGVNVVGRTRFCIHPAEKVKRIAAVGGTKDIDWAKVNALNADLIILDREENPKFMADLSPVPVLATHVRSVAEVAAAFDQMAAALSNPGLKALAHRWRSLKPLPAKTEIVTPVPALIQWGAKPARPFRKFTYLIWKNPWMTVARSTFIGSVFETLGYAELMADFSKPYPEIKLDELDPQSTLLLFSSEPYPFAKKIAELNELPFTWALVDGEKLSWFGIRSLRFLEAETSGGRTN